MAIEPVNRENTLFAPVGGLPIEPEYRHLGLGRPEVRGLYYNGKALKLDGYRFVDCRFDNCKLTISSASFELINCVVDNSNQFIYSDGVAKVLKAFLSRYDWATPAYFSPFFLPEKGANGAISIADRRP